MIKLSASQKSGLLKVANKLEKLADMEDKVTMLKNKNKISAKKADLLFNKIHKISQEIADEVADSDLDIDLDLEDFEPEFNDFNTDEFSDLEAQEKSDIEKLSEEVDDFDAACKAEECEDEEIKAEEITDTQKSALLKIASKLEILADRQDEINKAFSDKKISAARARFEKTKLNASIKRIASEIENSGADIDIEVK